MCNKYVDISSYNIYREDYGRGGGVCIYVKSNLKVTEFNIGNINQLRHFPSLIIGCFYRHPKATADSFNFISECIKSVLLRNKSFFICGDFNDDLFQTNNKMSKLISNLKLYQLVDKPTRVTANTATLLDLLITNNKNMVNCLEILPGPVADHEAISVTLNISNPKRLPIYKTFRTMRNYSQDFFCSLLINEVATLNNILNTDDIDIQTNILTSVMNVCLDKCAPLVTRQILRPPAPWISEEIKSKIRERNQLQKNLKVDRKNTALRENY